MTVKPTAAAVSVNCRLWDEHTLMGWTKNDLQPVLRARFWLAVAGLALLGLGMVYADVWSSAKLDAEYACGQSWGGC